MVLAAMQLYPVTKLLADDMEGATLPYVQSGECAEFCSGVIIQGLMAFTWLQIGQAVPCMLEFMCGGGEEAR